MNGPNIFTETPISRRKWLQKALLGVGACVVSSTGILRYKAKQASAYPGSLLGASSQIGHLIRDSKLNSSPENLEEIETVIIGGGVAGLSSAWWLKKNGYENFKLLELESEVGGNSLSGKNSISAYPWGAHYLPLPGPEARYCKTLLEEIGVIQGYDVKGLPIYNEYYLCSDPQERLFIQGKWQEGLVPQIGMSPEDRREYEQFFSMMEKYKNAKGRDGKRAFVIPIDLSSKDPEFRELDQLSMDAFMRSKGWTSKYLHWYVNYCCRDDYGVGHTKVSAWAGIHYFSSRIGIGSGIDVPTVLTWPEGNGWLAEQLRRKSVNQIRSQSLVYSIQLGERNTLIDYLDTQTHVKTRIKAQRVIFAAPRFTAIHLIHELKSHRPQYFSDLHYTPWMVANVSLRSRPQGNGAPLSWENVSFYSRSMGYVNSTHQNLTLIPRETVLTYYLPLDDQEPQNARKEAFKKTHSDWAKCVADDLELMHPGIKKEIIKIDVWVWGHGMVNPSIGFIWGKSREAMNQSLGGQIYFAHSDMSGISVFEEAQYRGVIAANRVLKSLGRDIKEGL